MIPISSAIHPVALVLAAAIGLLIGSFLNVVIARVPAGLSVVTPRSSCPNCARQLPAAENIPVLSWLALRGRCHGCRTPISISYPLIEIASAAAFTGIIVWLAAVDSNVAGPNAAWSEVIAYSYFAACSIALTVIDIRTHRLPDRIVLPMYLIGAALFAAAAVSRGDIQPLLTALIGAVAFWAGYALMRLAYPTGMGLGDVKLAGAVGLFVGWFGWEALLAAAFAPFLLGGLFASVLLITRKVTRKTRLPFGPWIILGAWIGLIAGPSIVGAYLSFVGFAA